MQILSELLPQVIQEISWPRSMRWNGSGTPRFIRPIRWIVALLGGKVVRLEFAGVPGGGHSVGHRFLGKRRIRVTGIRDYATKLRANFVITRAEERRRKIERELHAAVSRKGLQVHGDERLFELVTYLNEYPSVILGHFDERFLELPEEILITVMRDHQKYFAVERRDGRLAPHFLAVINLDRDRAGLVRAGHERVLRARFEDARFFWETDQKCRLADYLPRLANVIYESRLGSYRDKVERMRALAGWVAGHWFDHGVLQSHSADADRAAELAKCDLVTGMVGELPELQGVVGGLYARAQGEPDEVAWAIYDHYRPVGLEDPIPRNLTGCAVSLADKLDSIVGCFAVGIIPSGSSDPFALRRAALGVVKILLERKLPLSLSAAVTAATKGLAAYPPKKHVSEEVQAQVLGFLAERATFILRERAGFAYDELNAVFSAGADDLMDAVRRLEALKAIRRTKNFEPLAVSFKRIRKILEKAGPEREWRMPSVSADLLREEAEKALYAAAGKVGHSAREHKRAGRYREALQGIAQLRPAVDRFFDEVLVMTEDEQVRQNRLTMLAELLKEFSTVADFSEIVVKEQASRT